MGGGGGRGRVVVVALVLGRRSRVGSSEPHATKLGLYMSILYTVVFLHETLDIIAPW